MLLSKELKRKSLSVDEKIEAILAVDKGEKKSAIALRLGIPPNTLSTWIKNRDKIFSTYDITNPCRKRQRLSAYADVEEALLRWFQQARTNSVAISGPVLTAQARKFADALGHAEFQCSSGWLDRFKQRHGISGKCITGESSSVTSDLTSDWMRSSLPKILQQFKPKDIYNMDETGLFFRMTPDRTLTFKGDTCHGGKKSKERVTAAVCANMDGTDKLELLIIGKFQNPRCFKNVKKLPVEYLANRKAWMTSEIFENWLRKLDRKFVRDGRKILMLVDNCPAHPKVQNLKAIKLKFLPPNTTSCLQPMDQGIIQNLKVLYRRLVVERVLRSVENGETVDNSTVTLLDAVRMLHSAWYQLKPETIANCFRHAGFVVSAQINDDDNDDVNDLSAAAASIVASQPVTERPKPVVSLSDARNIWDNLRSAGFFIQDDVSFNDYCTADCEVAVSETLDDTAIVQSVTADNQAPAVDGMPAGREDDDDDNDVDDSSERQPVTTADALNALTVLRGWLECNTTGQQSKFHLVAELENYVLSCRRMQQTTINNFFKTSST